MEKQLQPIAPGRSGQVVRATFGQPSSRFNLDYATWHAHLAGLTGQGTPTAAAATGRVVNFDPASGRTLTIARQSA
jgi:hypothetical protein